MKAKMFLDDSGLWRWHLVASNGLIVADGSEGYQRIGACRGALVRWLHLLSGSNETRVGHFEFYVDRGQGHRWRYNARNGRILSDSGQAYTRSTSSRRAVRSIVAAAQTGRIPVMVIVPK